MGNAVQLAADVQYVAAKRLLSDRVGAKLIIKRLGRHERPIGGLFERGSLLSQIAPVGITVPVHEANQGVVDLVYEPPCPIPPHGCESLDPGSANQRFASSKVRTQPIDHALGHFLIDPSIMLEREKTARNPRTVRLVPYAPVPIAHSLPAPLLNAATYDVRTSVGKRSNRPGIVEWRR